MKKHLSPVTFHYMIITAGFWMAYCVSVAYAAVYLQYGGYTNLELGVILAVGNLGGAFLSPLFGAWIDRNRKIRHAAVVDVLLGLQVVLLVLLRLKPEKSLFCTIVYILYMAFAMPVNALNLDLCVRLEHAGADLNFGLARSMGSFAFVILSTLLGILTERLSPLMLPWAGLAVILLQFVGNRLVDRDLRNAEAELPENSPALAREKSSSLIAFIRENGSFCLMLFGTIIIFVAHNIDCNFLINVVKNLGEGSAVMGYVASFTAIVEVPVMMFANKLPKRFSRVQYIRASFVFFVLKLLAYALAPNIPLLFAARILQAPSYALYTVLIVGYADEVVPRKDSAKAQSLAFSMTTIGAVIASLIGGRMYDTTSVRTTLLTAAAIALAGCVIATLGTLKKPERKLPAAG